MRYWRRSSHEREPFEAEEYCCALRLSRGRSVSRTLRRRGRGGQRSHRLDVRAWRGTGTDVPPRGGTFAIVDLPLAGGGANIQRVVAGIPEEAVIITTAMGIETVVAEIAARPSIISTARICLLAFKNNSPQQ